MVFLLLRRLSPRARFITGVVLVAAGLVVIAVSAVVAGLLIHGIALAVIGAAMCVSGRPARAAADQPAVDDELALEADTNAR
jgi:membrane-bound ClpP family serine protease